MTIYKWYIYINDIYPTYSYPLVHIKHPHSIIPVDVVSSFPSMVPGTVARRATTRREQQVLPFVEPQSGREVAPCPTKGMGLWAMSQMGGGKCVNFPQLSWEAMKKIEKVWESWATPRFGTLALLLKCVDCVDNPKVWDVDVVFFCVEWCRMRRARTLDCSEEWFVGKVSLSGKEGWYAEFVSVLLALFYGPVDPVKGLTRRWGLDCVSSLQSSISRESHICGPAAFWVMAGGGFWKYRRGTQSV